MDGKNLRDAAYGYVDHIVFFITLGSSTLIGLYFGCFKSQNSVSEYAFGGKIMSFFPISMSIVATFISGVSLIGLPSEIYVYGTQIYVIVVSNIAAGFILNKFYWPYMYELKCTSYFEYLEKRFNHTVRSIGCFLYLISLLLVVPVAIYIPSLAYEQVTGISKFKLAIIFCTLCILYTSLGGLKAVVWADAIQNICTLAAALAIAILGLIQVGGIGNVFESSMQGGRLELFNFDFNPLRRNTFPTVFMGSLMFWLSNLAGNPAAYQRIASLSSYTHLKKSAILSITGAVIINSIMAFVGLIIFAKYQGCDPIITKEVNKPDQLTSYFVIDVARDFPGLAGLFFSGVVSASLSTMSTFLNTAALTVYYHFIKPFLPLNTSDKTANLTMKITTIILGIACTALVVVVDKLGTLFQLSNTLIAVTNGITFYLFTLGMFFPWANSKGAFTGAIAALISTIWIVAGAQIAIARGDLKFPGKITSIKDCPANLTLQLNLTSTEFGFSGYGTPVEAAEYVPMAYRISYFYVTFIGFAVGMIVAILVSLVTGQKDISKLDSNLIAPQLRHLLPTKDLELQAYSMVPMKDVEED